MKEQASTPTTTRLLRMPEVLKKLGISSTTVWRLSKKNDFPPAIRISPGAVGWREADIERWIAERAG